MEIEAVQLSSRVASNRRRLVASRASADPRLLSIVSNSQARFRHTAVREAPISFNTGIFICYYPILYDQQSSKEARTIETTCLLKTLQVMITSTQLFLSSHL